MMTYQGDGCRIWRGYEGKGFSSLSSGEIIVEHSPRAGGGYTITLEAKWMMEDSHISDSHRARITSILIDQRAHGVKWPQVTTALIEEARTRMPTSVDERAERLLRYIARQAETIAAVVDIREETYGAYAWSESVDWSEVVYLLNYLQKMELIQGQRSGEGWFLGGLTVAGHRRIAEQRINVDSSQALVAMWFDDSMDEAFETGIKPAVEDAGYVPLRIDRKDHVNKIDDEIVAELRRSRFVVADFTHGDGGARGGVYYEAGFAHGLSLPVIFTCRKDYVKSLHFDTNHYSHIVWNTPAELRERLKTRILAVIRQGPGSPMAP